MAEPARTLQNLPDPPSSREAGDPRALRRLPPNLPVILNARQLATARENMAALGGAAGASPLRFVDVPAHDNDKNPPRNETAVLRGIKDLQQLQKQTIAVLEAVKANLDDIQQVLRSPEATRGLEKQQNAATLLSKGFARDAVEQAMGAVALLPANPEAHLLLALSLAADQQFDESLATTRKGLALFDRRTHPLAIEAGLLHALAALGCGPEAAERWAAIIDALPIPVLLEHLGRIAACFPSDAPDVQLDELITRRLTRDPRRDGRQRRENRRSRMKIVETRPGEIPAPALFAGLDAAHFARLADTHRAILGQIARRLGDAADATDIVRFLTDCVIPLGNIGLDRSAGALGRAAIKRLLRLHADAMTLYRAMTKLEMAGAAAAMREVAQLLNHWRRAGTRAARARQHFAAAGVSFAAGVALLAATLSGLHLDILWAAAAIGLGCALGVTGLMNRHWIVKLPCGRSRLSPDELRFLRTAEVKHALRAATRPRKRSSPAR